MTCPSKGSQGDGNSDDFKVFSYIEMARIINTFKWFGNNPKKSIFLGLIAGFGGDYFHEKYL